MARKLPGLRRELDARSLYSVAYGEIAVVDLLRARDHRAARRRLHAARAARRRPALPRRRPQLRRGDLGPARDRRRGDVRPARRQRPRRLHDRLGALPRLPDRDRPLGAVPAALPRGCPPDRRAQPPPVGHHRRRRRHRRDRRDPDRAPALVLRDRDRRAGTRRARPARPDRLRLRAPLLTARADARHLARNGADVQVARLLDPARAACLYGSRDGREPRRGGAAAERRPAAVAVRGDRHRRHHVRRDCRRRPLGVPRPADGARDDVAERPARRRRRCDPRPHLGGARRHDPVLRRRERRPDPARVGDDVDLRLLPARLLARRARAAAARVRTAAPAHARLAAGDRQRHGGLERDRDRLGVPRAQRRLPRQCLLLRRPARVHRHADRGDLAPHRRARPASPLPDAAQRQVPRGRDPGARDRRRRRHLRDLDHRALHARGRPLRRRRLARDRPRRLRHRSPLPRRGPDRAGGRRPTRCTSTTCRASAGSSCR